MKCAVHTDVDATGYCRNCGKAMCSACARRVRDVLYCEDCLAQVMGHSAPGQPMPTVPPSAGAPTAASPYGSVSSATESAPAYSAPSTAPSYAAPPGAPYQVRGNQSSPAAAFILALVFPGLGAIYNRQYNTGLVYVALFAALVLGIVNGFGGIEPVLGIALAGLIFYSAFEAMQTAQARNRGETPSDPLETWTKQRPVGPILLIGLGVLFLLENFDVPIHLGKFWPLVLIGIGVYMFRNRLLGRP